MQPDWLRWARELQAVAQSGLRYAQDPDLTGDVFDAERYRQVSRVAAEIMAAGTDAPFEAIAAVFDDQTGHATPKIDVRGVIFNRRGHVLLVQERLDGNRWTLPGGWADVNESPSEAVSREVEEETGYQVRPTRLLALWDRDRHDHPPSPFHSWKVFVACEIAGGAASSTLETSSPEFWPVDDLPSLSTSRVTAQQLRRLRSLYRDASLPAAFD